MNNRDLCTQGGDVVVDGVDWVIKEEGVWFAYGEDSDCVCAQSRFSRETLEALLQREHSALL